MKTQDLTKDTKGEIVIYQSEEGRVSVDVLFQDETVWLPIEQMSILFGKSRSTINEHILNIYKEGELSEADTVRKIGISDFSTKPTNFYNLDVVISVGYLSSVALLSNSQAKHPKYSNPYYWAGFIMLD